MKKNLLPDHRIELLEILKTRFEENTVRHKNIKWTDVQKRLETKAEKLWSLAEMERGAGTAGPHRRRRSAAAEPEALCRPNPFVELA